MRSLFKLMKDIVLLSFLQIRIRILLLSELLQSILALHIPKCSVFCFIPDLRGVEIWLKEFSPTSDVCRPTQYPRISLTVLHTKSSLTTSLSLRPMLSVHIHHGIVQGRVLTKVFLEYLRVRDVLHVAMVRKIVDYVLEDSISWMKTSNDHIQFRVGDLAVGGDCAADSMLRLTCVAIQSKNKCGLIELDRLSKGLLHTHVDSEGGNSVVEQLENLDQGGVVGSSSWEVNLRSFRAALQPVVP